MKRKKVLAALLAGALVMSSAAFPNSMSVKAENRTLEDGLVASYDFNKKDLTNGVSEQGQAEAIVTGLGAYEQALTYEAGDTDKGQALKLGDYGLKLNQQDLGDDFSVSMWLKPNGDFAENEAVMFLGYHSPEKWLAVAGSGNPESDCKFWTNGSGNGQSFGWTGFGNMTIDSSWHCLTVTGSNEGVTAYLDGKAVGTGGSIAPLTGENQDIYIGVNNWDTEFDGLVDDIKVYNRKLSEQEVLQLYNPEITPEEVLDAEGITVTEALHTIKGRTSKITVNMPAVAVEAGAKVKFESQSTEIATVDEEGVVTAQKAGETSITTTVTLGSVTKTAETMVYVENSLNSRLTAVFDFEDGLSNSAEGAEGAAQAASLIVTGLKAYNGEAVYKDGHAGKAIQLGEYGLKLNQENLGTDYTVSAWVKADQAMLENQCMLFLGYHNPENWIAISGMGRGNAIASDNFKVWAKGGIYGSHTTLFSPMIQSQEWHQITLTETAGQLSVYLDGIYLGTANSNAPLVGENQDIYLGVNNWDTEYTGLMDEVKVYSLAMTEEEVQQQAAEEFSEKLQKKLEKELTVKDILGKNSSEKEVYYNLSLPTAAAGIPLSWSTDHEDIIGADGVVKGVSADQEVTVTATASSQVLQAALSFKVTVKAVDSAKLTALLEEAEKVDQTYLTDVSKERLQAAIAAAETAVETPTYEAVEKAYTDLKQAMEELYYVTVENPFDAIVQPKVKTTLQAGTSEQLMEIPEAVKDMVTVTYASEDENVAGYENGTVTANAVGKTIVTATVTAKDEVLGYGGFSMNYSTAVEVTEENPPAHVHNLTKVEGKEPTCTAAGNMEYWYCEECGKYFADQDAVTEISGKDTILPMKEHEWETEYTVDKEPTATEAGSKSIHCKHCDAKMDVQVIPATGTPGSTDKPGNQKPTESVQTGDTTWSMPWILLLGVSALGCIVVIQKRRTEK